MLMAMIWLKFIVVYVLQGQKFMIIYAMFDEVINLW